MTDALIDYFVRHYTLILDNEQGSYARCKEIAENILIGEGVTFEEYQSMSPAERTDRFASDIGDNILDMINDEVEETLAHSDRQALGRQLIGEIMIFSDSELAWELGKHYMPDDSEMEGVLDSGHDQH